MSLLWQVKGMHYGIADTSVPFNSGFADDHVQSFGRKQSMLVDTPIEEKETPIGRRMGPSAARIAGVIHGSDSN
jgi:hypothetical protein